MKILFVTPCIPSESDGRRPYNFIKYLASRHEVHVLALQYTVQTATHIQAIERLGVSVTAVPANPVASVSQCVKALFQNIPFRAAWVKNKAFARTLHQLIGKHRFDVIHFDRMRMGQFAVGIGVPCVIDFTDSLVMYLERSKRFRTRWLERIIDSWEQRTIPDYERLLFSHCKTGLVCSTVDADFLKNYLGDAPVEVIRNAVDIEQFQPRFHGESQRLRCVLTGTLFYFPNVDSVRYYAGDIHPLLRKTFPHLETQIIGTRPSKDVLQYQNKEGISIVADVPKMEDYLFADDIYLCPLRVAAGIRNKLLEAMAAGMPVVTTRLGAEGMDVKHEREVLFAETPEDYVAAIQRLIDSPELRERLRENGRKYVTQNHRLDVLGQQIEELYQRLVDR